MLRNFLDEFENRGTAQDIVRVPMAFQPIDKQS